VNPKPPASPTRRKALAAALALTGSYALPLRAQSYPDKPIRMVIPFAAGGPTDVIGRIVGQKLSELLKQPLVIDNRVGATGSIGAELVAKSPADGYTLLMGTSSIMAANPVLNPKVPYDPIKDFAPISLTGTIENVLVVHPSVPAKTVPEFIAYLKANPGKLSYSSSGIGSTYHLGAELFCAQTGTKMLHVPYKGAAPAALDLLAGNVQVMFDNLASALPNIKTGKVRALGIASLKRTPELPELPTIAESGVPGYETTIWLAMFAPAKTPKEIIAALNHAVVAVMAAPDIQERYTKQGMTALSSTPEKLTEYNRNELVKWGRVVKDANIKME
jgi:tripartite-type tricarboxylate transporter receptor subunit TctC